MEIKGYLTFLKARIMSMTLIGVGSYPTAEMQLAYSSVPANRAVEYKRLSIRKSAGDVKYTDCISAE